ncbi:MAG TPA: M48 family metalloprotease [Armatimonadota bacterium]|jgi:Zn-dependent protease with chaperone function
MNHTEYETRVAALESIAYADPALFRRRFFWNLLLGYALMIAVPLMAITLTAGYIYYWFHGGTIFIWAFVMLVAVSGVTVVATIKALLLPLPHDLVTGPLITRQDAPLLFTRIDDICQQLHVKPCQKIYLFAPTNALAHIAFTRHRDAIVMGLPLLYALSPEQFIAVLAHEFAHCTREQTRNHRITMRLLTHWLRLLREIDTHSERQTVPGFAIDPVLNIPSHLFDALYNQLAPKSFVIQRLDEIAADAAAAAYAGKDACAEAQIAIGCVAEILEKSFWPRLDDMLAAGEDVPTDLFTGMQTFLKNEVTRERIEAALPENLAQIADCLDPHPAFTDRLARFGYTRERLKSSAVLAKIGSGIAAAADTLVPESTLTAIVAQMNHEWANRVRPLWMQRQQEMAQARVVVESLGEHEYRDPDTMMKHACAVLELSGEEAALPILHEILAGAPDHVPCHYLLGKLLLGRNDETGVQHLNRVMELDIDYALSACQLAEEFYVRRHNPQGADAYAQCKNNIAQLLQRARQERHTVTVADHFHPHAWPEDELHALQEYLSQFRAIGHAYLVRKEITCLPEKSGYVLGIAPNRPCRWFSLSAQRSLPGKVAGNLKSERLLVVIELVNNYYALEKHWKKIPEACIYRKAGR